MMQINCPVCSYQDITGDTCPNCDADLSVIRMLQELPELPTPSPWTLRIALLLLILGIGLGMGTSLIFWQPQFSTVVVTQPSPVNPPSVIPQKPPEPNTYIVKPGDNLSAIAQQLCSQGVSLQTMLQTNPQLIGRENYLEVGQVLKIPNCQEGSQ